MRSFIGLLWALGGGAVGLVVGIIAGVIVTKLANTPSREGAAGYVVIAIGILGALLGLVAGMVLYGRSAPSGQGFEFAGSSFFGVAALVGAIALGIWAFLNLRETPAMYGNAMADLLLEVRIRAEDAPPDSTRWLQLEVQTAKTRPEGSVLWSKARDENGYHIVPVTQGPLQRAANRFIVVTIEGRQTEMFSPPMKRMPDPKADWSAWYKPGDVSPAYGTTPSSPLKPLLELRYRIRVYGQE